MEKSTITKIEKALKDKDIDLVLKADLNKKKDILSNKKTVRK